MMGGYLRSGYTTGTCASAAARAAAVFLLTGKAPDRVSVLLGNGTRAEFAPEYGFWQPDKCWCRVKKDGGDDPDITDGVWVYAEVFLISEEEFAGLCRKGKGYTLKEYPGIYLNGGSGIGIAAKKGLSCPAGRYAINPVPRQVILREVDSVRREACCKRCLEVRIAIPEGAALAEKTFNPVLGIRGGISVLGTTGVVEPMSEQALVETIRLDIRVRAAAGENILLLTPGNYGETFLWQELGIELGTAVKCSNFVEASVKIAKEEGFHRLLLVGHIGKMIKVAGGAGNTHSKYGDRRMELMERLTRQICDGMWREPEAERELFLREIKGSNTTEEAVERLKKRGLAEPVLNLAAEQVKEQIAGWLGGGMKAEMVVFSSLHKAVGKTRGADEFLHLFR